MVSKEDEILELFYHGDLPFKEIQKYAVSSGGLINTEIRSKLWPILLSLSHDLILDWEESVPRENTVRQIELDIRRSLNIYDIINTWEEGVRDDKTMELNNILQGIAYYNGAKQYYQGLNSVASIFLLVCGQELGFQLTFQCCEQHLKEFMREDPNDGLLIVLELLYELLEFCDEGLTALLREYYPSGLFPCISWIITWFSHELHGFEEISRIFDFCLATHSLASVYITAIIVLRKAEEIKLCTNPEDIHIIIKSLIKDMDIEFILERALLLMRRYQPDELCSTSELRAE